MYHSPIILASGSPRRSELLKEAQIPFEVVLPTCDEDYPSDTPISIIAEFLAQKKALSVAELLFSKATGTPTIFKTPQSASPIILAADTIVVINGRVLGKPKDKTEAISMLSSLSSTSHTVYTGVCLLKNFKKRDHQVVFTESVNVSMRELSLELINYYIDNYSPFDKAGSYGIQEFIGISGVLKIEGSYTAVLGLPIARVLEYLKCSTAFN